MSLKNRKIYIAVVVSSLSLVAIIYVVMIFFQSNNKVNNRKINDKDACHMPKFDISTITTKKIISDKRTDVLFKGVGTQRKPVYNSGINACIEKNLIKEACDYNSNSLGESHNITNETRRQNEQIYSAPTYTMYTKPDQIHVDNTTGGHETNFLNERNSTKEISYANNQNQTCQQNVNEHFEVLQDENTIKIDQIDMIREFIEANETQSIAELIEQVEGFMINSGIGQPEFYKQFSLYFYDYVKKAENINNNDVTRVKILMKNFFQNLKKHKINYENTNALLIPLINDNDLSNFLNVNDNLEQEQQENEIIFTGSKELNLVSENEFSDQDGMNKQIGQTKTVDTNMRHYDNVTFHKNWMDKSQVYVQNNIADNIQYCMDLFNVGSNNPHEKNTFADVEKINTNTNEHHLHDNQLTTNAEMNKLSQKSCGFTDAVNLTESKFDIDSLSKTYCDDIVNTESTVNLHLDTLHDQKASFNQKSSNYKRKSEQSACDYATSENNKSALDKYLDKKVESLDQKIKQMLNDKNHNKKNETHASYDHEEIKPLLFHENLENHVCTCYDSKERYRINSYSSINLKNHYLTLPQKKYLNIDIRQKYYTEITLETCQENLEVIEIILMKLIPIDGCRFMDLFKLYLQHIIDNIDNYYLIPNKMCNDKRRKILYIQDNLIDRWSKKFKPQTYYSCCHKAERFDIYITFYIDEIILGKKRSSFIKKNNYKYLFLLKKNKVKETPVYYYL